MATGWDPKITSRIPADALRQAQGQTPEKAPGSSPRTQTAKADTGVRPGEPPAAPEPKKAPDSDLSEKTSTANKLPAGSRKRDPGLERAEKLATQLRAGVNRRGAAQQILEFGWSPESLRSRRARRRIADLCGDLEDAAPGASEEARWLKAVLDALELFEEATGPWVLEGSLRLIERINDEEERRRREGDQELSEEEPSAGEGIAKATLAQGLIELAVHFPRQLSELGLDQPTALEHALDLAEEAVAQAPHRPEGLVALARLVLTHQGPQAITDAEVLLDEAEAKTPDHDGVTLAKGACAIARNDGMAAIKQLEILAARGNSSPDAATLRGLALMAQGDFANAAMTFERLTMLNPSAPYPYLHGARAAGALGQEEERNLLLAKATELLGQGLVDALAGDMG